MDWKSLIQYLTLGAFGDQVFNRHRHLPQPSSDFWKPRIISNIRFASEDGQHHRLYHYLELLAHTEKAAWDLRSIWARVQVDIRRDYLRVVKDHVTGEGGGTIDFSDPQDAQGVLFDRLSALKLAIDRFEALLENHGDEHESIFHDFLQQNPILLDVYGVPTSKPRFAYPEGHSPLGKAYVEPDFIIRYPGNVYKLIELERPSKKMATSQGQPRNDVTQSTFQIAEWTVFIRKHPETLEDKFPGIATNFTSMVVISRATEESVGGGRNVQAYLDLVRAQFAVEELLLYDDLLARAKQAYAQLSTIRMGP